MGMHRHGGRTESLDYLQATPRCAPSRLSVEALISDWPPVRSPPKESRTQLVLYCPAHSRAEIRRSATRLNPRTYLRSPRSRPPLGSPRNHPHHHGTSHASGPTCPGRRCAHHNDLHAGTLTANHTCCSVDAPAIELGVVSSEAGWAAPAHSQYDTQDPIEQKPTGHFSRAY